MKIGFDVSQTGRTRAGCGFFALSLIEQLAALDRQNEYVLYPTFGDYFWNPNWRAEVCRINRSNFQCAAGQPTVEEWQHFWRDPTLDFTTRFGDVDLVHSNNYYCPRDHFPAKLVYTLYDLSFLEHPDWTTESNRVGCFEGVFQASVNADLIVAISEFSRRHFLETFPHFPAEKTTVIPLGSRFAQNTPVPLPPRLAKFSARKFWLCVGTIEPRKNHRGVLRAYWILKQRYGKCPPLLIAGQHGWMMQGFEEQIRDLGLADDVHLLGYVDDSALQWLYQNCLGLIYPSFWEGFGLPVLEAMGQGAPVITSYGSSLEEIGADAAILVDPKSDECIAEAMGSLQVDEARRQSVSQRSLARAEEFSWEASARALLSRYECLSGASLASTGA
jgi:glycosyltransferase involved in cell wall biosynthesis